MTPPVAAPDGDRITPGMFHTSARLGRLERLLRPLPRTVGEEILAAAAVVDGLVHPSRFRRARAWAAEQPGSGRSPGRLAIALLANHGRFCGEEAFVGVSSVDDLRRGVVLEGGEHLDVADGAILLGFHLGPPRTWFRLRALGYPVRLAGRLEGSVRDPRWVEAFRAHEAVRLVSGVPADRLPGLYQIRALLREGAMVFLTADGPFGREAFRLDLPGGPLIVRSGWLTLRRLTRAPTLPVFGHRDGSRNVVVVHPPLPPPAADPVRDAAMCRAVLAPLVERFVREFPEQCRYLALPPWPTSLPERGEALDRADGAT